MFLTFFFEPFLVGKVMKENLLRKVWKSEKRKVKNIRKYTILTYSLLIKGDYQRPQFIPQKVQDLASRALQIIQKKNFK